MGDIDSSKNVILKKYSSNNNNNLNNITKEYQHLLINNNQNIMPNNVTRGNINNNKITNSIGNRYFLDKLLHG